MKTQSWIWCYKQIGNAVPVRLAAAVAEPIAQWVKMQIGDGRYDGN